MRKMVIGLDSKGTGYNIDCPVYLNHLIQGAPNRRFCKGPRIWKAQATRLNAQYFLGLLDPNSHTSSVVVAGPGVLQHLQDKAVGKDPKSEPFPKGYKYKTKPYGLQVEALERAWGKDAFAFFMEMGTGKSKVYSDLASALYLHGKIDGVLILTKYTLRSNILREFHIHANVADLHTLAPEFDTVGARKKAAQFNASKERGLYVASIGLESLSSRHLGGQAYDFAKEFLTSRRVLAVVDESHLIKGYRSTRTANTQALGRLAPFRVIGTGTEILKGPLDLYSQFEFLDPDILGAGDFYSFRNRYAEMGGYEGKEVVGYRNMEELTDLLRPWVYQALKKDHLDLPEKVYMPPVTVELTKEQRRVYAEVRKDKLAIIRSERGDFELVCQNILSAYLALQQVCAGFVTYNNEEEGVRSMQWVVAPEKNPKYAEAMQLVQEYSDRQFIIWSRHVPEIKAITAWLKTNGVSAECYHGGVKEAERQAIADDFVAGKILVFVSNPATAGTGLTFVNCHDVIYLSNDFNLGNRLQSEDRTHRIGQKVSVNYHEIVAANSVELMVLDNLRGKMDVADYVRSMVAKGADPANLI